MKPFGYEFRFDPTLSAPERLFVRLFRNPILGLRIRARGIVPVLRSIAQTNSSAIQNICDCGCGRGMFSFYLTRLFPGAKVVGLDIDKASIARNTAIAKNCPADNLQFRVQDISKLPYHDEFDLLLSTDCLEHLINDRKQLELLAGAIRSGGHLVIHVPHETRNLFGWKRKNFMGIEGHVRPGYTKNGLVAMAESVGLTCEECFYTYGYFETLANDISYLITGGREKNRLLYALCMPLLIALSLLGKGSKLKGHEGSGLVLVARKSGSKADSA